MKIYPSNHEIISTKRIDKNFDIPLAYIDSNFSDIKINIKCKETNDYKKMVLPYDSFDNLDIILFNEFNEEVKTIDILRRDDKNKKYYYIPKDSISYSPQKFSYKILAKKALEYSSSKLYNINVISTDLDFVKNIITVFGDAPRRKLCPSNISVNKQETVPMKFLNDTLRGDIIFIISEDGIHYKGTDTKIDFKLYLDRHINVWLVTDSLFSQSFANNIDFTYSLKEPIIYKNHAPYKAEKVMTEELILNQNNYINTSIDYNKEFVNIFDKSTVPVSFLRYDKKAFIAISSSDFFKNIKDNVDLLYECMMYVYCNSYIESNLINTWAADEMPDYIVENGKAIKKERLEHPIEVSKIFSINSNQISICDIIPDAPNILIDDLTNSFVVFKKNMNSAYDKYKDGFNKPQNSKTIFTLRQDIMCYKNFLYLIVDDVKDKIKYIIKNNKVFLKIEPFKNSLKGININEPTFLELPLFKIRDYKETKVSEIAYCLYCKENILNVVDSEFYSKDKYGELIAEINIKKEKNTPTIYDIRQRGGGAVESEKNYDLLDVGNTLGRPYRKAGSFIITMPKDCEPYKDIIEQAVKRHCVSEEYPIILFE